MGNNFSLARSYLKLYRPSRQSRVNGRAGVNSSPGQLVLSQKALALTLAVILGMTAFSYLMLVNGRVSKGFEIQILEKKLAELQKNQRTLERESADLQSIQNIEQKVNLADYTPTLNIQYLPDAEMALTVK